MFLITAHCKGTIL